MLAERDLKFVEANWRKVPLGALAARYGLNHLDLVRLLRERGVCTEIQPIELQYIRENIDRQPPGEIQERLALTKSQFQQILHKIFGKKLIKSLDEWTRDEVVAKTKWLVEEKLKLPIDDFLPRTISNDAFVRNGLFGCLRYAEHHKKFDDLYRHFSAVAYLICQAYPDSYRPFQFRHAKTNQYFTGFGGKKNLISAIKWVLETKLHIKPESYAVVSQNKYFLRTTDLEFYGVGYHWYKRYFASREELVAEIVKSYGILESPFASHRKRLVAALTEAGVSMDRCHVPGCQHREAIDVHHIVPRSAKSLVKIDIHASENLVPLCPNHHRMAQKLFPWRELLNLPERAWRARLTDFLARAHTTQLDVAYRSARKVLRRDMKSGLATQQ